MILYIFAEMKRYKVREIIKILMDDGWFVARQNGSHRQFRHPDKPGTVTVNSKPGDTLDQDILNSIFKQAGWQQSAQK